MRVCGIHGLHMHSWVSTATHQDTGYSLMRVIGVAWFVEPDGGRDVVECIYIYLYITGEKDYVYIPWSPIPYYQDYLPRYIHSVYVC